MSQPRRVEVDPARLPGWIDRFAASHGHVTWSVVAAEEQEPAAWLAEAEDGSWARLEGWSPPVPPAGDEAGWEEVAAPLTDAGRGGQHWWSAPGALLVVLVRRGGYAVAVATGTGELVAHKVGTRRVQGRSAAGGWSQQRFARRRANQADDLVEALVGHARRIVEEAEGRLRSPVGALVLGGDPPLREQALSGLATGPLARLRDLPRRELGELADPRRAVLDDAVRRGLAVRVVVRNAES